MDEKGNSGIPDEIWVAIFSYLDFETRQEKAVLVCKKWYSLIRESVELSGKDWSRNNPKIPGFGQIYRSRTPGIETSESRDFENYFFGKYSEVITVHSD